MLKLNDYTRVNGTVTAFTAGAAPKTLAGATLRTQEIEPATLTALVVPNAKTNTLTIAGKWQVSDDNSTWVDVIPVNNAATVVLVTGTGSDVTVTRCVEAPNGLNGFSFVRFALVTGTAVADGTDDKGTISYRYQKVRDL